MAFLEQEFSEITESTWQALLGVALKPRVRTTALESIEGFLTGRVEISGAWNGVLLFHGSTPLTKVVASIIFDSDHSMVTNQDQMDAMYELTNNLGVNLKSLLPEPCQLSLPCVLGTTPESLSVPGAEPVSDLLFDCLGQPLWVSVWKRRDC